MNAFRYKIASAAGNGGRSPLVVASRSSGDDPGQTIIIRRGTSSGTPQCSSGQVMRDGRCVPSSRVAVFRSNTR